jgi:hypothetical protein
MALKKVALYKGDSVQLCFLPSDRPKTLAAFDEIIHQREKTSITIDTYSNGYPISLDVDFLRDHSPYGEHQIGLLSMTGGDTIKGAFKFESLEEQAINARKQSELIELKAKVERLVNALDYIYHSGVLMNDDVIAKAQWGLGMEVENPEAVEALM